MSENIYYNILNLISKNDISRKEIIALSKCDDMCSFLELMNEIIVDDLEELLKREEFGDKFHIFLYTLGDLVETKEELFLLKLLIDRTLKSLKELTKDYNKGLKQKDREYYLFTKFIGKIKANREFLSEYLDFFDTSEIYKILWFVINELNTPDYLFRLFEVNPEYANLRDSSNVHLFVNLVNEYLSNLDNYSEAEIKNFKRIFVLFLESDGFKLSSDELTGILEVCEKNLMGNNISRKNNVKFLLNEIDRHYEIIHGDSRLTCVDYVTRECPKVIVNRENDEREDLTNLFTFSIDSCRGGDISKILIDDAISIESTLEGINLYIHIPDVDYFVAKDSETDLYMRALGESVYATGYKTPMLNYEIAKKCSLSMGSVKPAITLVIKLNIDGKVLDVDFKKSNINVNYNLSRSAAESFYSYSDDARLKNALHLARFYAQKLRKNRGETIGKMKMSTLIMEEFNVICDMVTASYFNDKGIIFPYKNYLGKKSVRSSKHVLLCEEFNSDYEISSEGRNTLYSIFDIYNRVYYDIEGLPNSSFNGKLVGNVGNPLRQYISLETDRLIKDLIISKESSYAYWEERIERDCIEYTETSSKIKELYSRSLRK